MAIEQEKYQQLEIQSEKFKNVAILKEFYPIYLIIDVEANKTSPYHLASNMKTFDFGYEITEIQTLAETNALAGALLDINGQIVPSEIYFIDATPKNFVPIAYSATQAKFLYCTNANMTRYKSLNIKLDAGWKLKILPYNAHTVAQEIYLLILGNKIFTKIIN